MTTIDKKIAGERLRALASSAKRSKAAQVRDLMDDIEAALAAGVPRSAIVKELAAQGLDMTLATFSSTLSRIRMKRKQTRAAAPTHERKNTTGTGSDEPGPDTRKVSHDPKDLKDIFRSEPDLDALAKLAKEKKR